MTTGDRLDAMLAGVREEVRARADAGGRVRDFATMMARAHALDPTAVPEAMVADAGRFARVVTLRKQAPVREDMERGSGRRRGVSGLAAAAAALLLAAGLYGAVHSARQQAETPAASAAPLMGSTGPASAAVTGEGPRAQGPGRAGRAHGAVAGGGGEEELPGAIAVDVDEDMSEEAVSREDAGGAESRAPIGTGDVLKDSSGQSGPGATVGAGKNSVDVQKNRLGRRPPAARGASEQAWEALDRAAREAWRRGDVVEARALLGALVRSDAEASRVELAYGDLFVLARRSGDTGELSRLWRAYLARFPRGIYAEDARAGLCRRATTEARRTACWELYLETWPEGVHADEAREAM